MARLLTDRQAEALLLRCGGASDAEIAGELRLSLRTVRSLMAQIRLRLGATDPVDLCALGADDVAAAVDRAQRSADTPQDAPSAPT
jgi:DNA-binding CsgD family transcriptional regulator